MDSLEDRAVQPRDTSLGQWLSRSHTEVDGEIQSPALGMESPARGRILSVLSPAVSQARSIGHVVAQVVEQVKGPFLFNWHYSV